MSFFIDYQEGKFTLSNDITPYTWCEVKEKNRAMDSYYISYMRFKNDSKFSILDDFSIRIHTENGRQYITISAYVTDKNNIKQYFIVNSNCPLFSSNSFDIRDAFICFLNTLFLFDNIEDANVVLETKDVFSYYEAEKFKIRVNSLCKILKNYGGRENFVIKSRIISWIRQAMLKFGYSVEEYNQKDENFQEIFSILNYFGYTVQKI